MTIVRHWNTPKIGEEQCLCPRCGWSGKVSDCYTRIDTVALCPNCNHWVEYRDPPKAKTIARVPR
jgi:uncharacterized protein (DUF983 family)